MKPEDNVAGYRADMAARGYSPTAAEAMTMDFHRHLLNVTFSQMTGAKRD